MDTRKKTITDDEMIDASVEVGRMFPDELQITLSLYTAILMAEIFGEDENSETKVYMKQHFKYVCGEHDFHVYTGGSLGPRYRVEHFKGNTFVTKETLPSEKEAFKFILVTLSDYIF